MASQVFAAIESLPSRKELAVHSKRSAVVKECAERVVGLCKLEHYKHKFASFSAELMSLLNSTTEGPRSCSSKWRRKMWVNFSMLRAERLPTLWRIFLQDLGCGDIKEPLFMELVNDSLLEQVIHSVCNTSQVKSSKPPIEMTIDEENILRYACGYVGMKLHNRFIRQHGVKAAVFVECIDQMYADGPSSSLLEYTREWVDRVNRGGLFDVSDAAYLLFYAIEEAMREKLTSHLTRSVLLTPDQSEEGKRIIIDEVVRDCDVQYRWSIISVDIIDDNDSLELLTHIVTLWLTIRGFSMSKLWMEDYKTKSATTTKNKKSLRKELKKKSATQASKD